MVAAKEKTLSFKSDSNIEPMDSQLAREPATTKSSTAINRISSYDFRTRKFKKSPIGPKVKIGCIVSLEINQRPRKHLGENVPRLRRSHQAPCMSLYRAYFVPGRIDPSGRSCGPTHTLSLMLGMNFIEGGTFGKIYRGIAKSLPISVTWDWQTGGEFTSQTCTECCDDGSERDVETRTFSPNMRFSISAQGGKGLYLAGGIELNISGSIENEMSPGCDGERDGKGCLSFTIEGEFKFCAGDGWGLVEGCGGIRASGSWKYCGGNQGEDEGFKGEGVSLFGEACAGFGAFCYDREYRLF